MESKPGEAQKGLIDGDLKQDLLSSINNFRVFQMENNQRVQVETNTLKFGGVRRGLRKEQSLLFCFIKTLTAE